MFSLGDSQLQDGLLHANEIDPFSSFPTDPVGAPDESGPLDSLVDPSGLTLTTPNALTDRIVPLNLNTIASFPEDQDDFDPLHPLGEANLFDPLQPFRRNPLLDQTSVPPSTFQILDKAIEPSEEQASCTALVPLNSSAAATPSNPAPRRRAMPGEFFEEDETDPLINLTRPTTPQSPTHQTVPLDLNVIASFPEDQADPLVNLTRPTTPQSPAHQIVPLDLNAIASFPEDQDSFDPLHRLSKNQDSNDQKNAETLRFMLALQLDARESEIFSSMVAAALRADLPPPWEKQIGRDGATCYVDVDNETIADINPLLPYVKQVVDVARMHFYKPSEKYIEQSKSSFWMDHAKELEAWHGPLVDSEGHSYFWNSISEKSTWHDPRLSAQRFFDVQCSLFQYLEKSLTVAQDTDAGPFDVSKGPPWEQQIASVGEAAEGYALALVSPEKIVVSPNQLMLSDQPNSARPLGEKAARVNQIMETSFNNKEHSFLLHKMSNTAEWVRGATEAEENVQRARLTQKRVQKLEDKKVRDKGRELAEAIHDPAINSAAFLGTAPLEIMNSWICVAAPLEHVKPWNIQQPRFHVGWQPWELWSKEPTLR